MTRLIEMMSRWNMVKAKCVRGIMAMKRRMIEGLGSDLTPGIVSEEDEHPDAEKNVRRFQIWTVIRPPLRAVEDLMSVRVNKKGDSSNGEQEAHKLKSSLSTDEANSSNGVYEKDSEDEFYDVERSDPIQDGSSDGTSVSSIYMPLERRTRSTCSRWCTYGSER
ncbi:hypothetical protein AALP_AAs50665U000800 [Arabis alpina]|uniref:Uncharacterized protein n=1 Tax=Arabis alpina TaxID=50452 RepID=A0A087FX59_ARAAL|nr:hypothetical protein AALP_AAs50665U000800 [Arabis alpina]